VCRDTASDRFYVRALDDSFFSYGSTEACSGEGTLFPDTVHFTPGLFYYVPSFSGAVLSLDPVTGVIDMSTSTKNSSYRVYYRTLGACRDTSFVLLDINASPVISGIEATPPGLSYCDSADVEMVCAGQGDVRWFVDGVLYTAQRTFESNTLQDGDTVRAVLSDPASGCSDTMEVTVQVLPRPVAEIADLDTVLTADGPFLFDLRAFQDHTVVFWSLEASNVDVGQTSGGGEDTLYVGDLLPVLNTASIINPYDPGYIVVSLIPQTFGCVGYRTTDTIRVTPGGLPVFIPEVITPNGDGKNDEWEILFSAGIDPAAHTIEVYNRAGAKVHVVANLTERWTGASNPDGVYWWILRDGTGAHVQQGGLTIRRR
jgi:gliding motility-associated-like protein